MAGQGADQTRTAIHASAARLFAEHGYAGTPVRAIAADAGIDAALVIRHFGTKERLFLDTMRLELEPHRYLDGPLEGLGERLVAYLMDVDADVRGIYLALLRASDADPIGSQLREAHERDFVAPLRAHLTGPEAELRARLAAAAVGGLLYALWVVVDEGLCAAEHDDLVTRYGAVVQGLLTPA